jgi:hypothetical protein
LSQLRTAFSHVPTKLRGSCPRARRQAPLSYLSFRLTDESISRHYHLLRDFALQHAEIAEIIAAID